jgi:hypothetical protein
MKNKILLLTGIFALLSVNAFAGQMKTIVGDVIDVSCYVAAGAKGGKHMMCATGCLKTGEPAGILEEKTGKVYLVVTNDHVTNPNIKVLPLAGKAVEVSGDVNERDGLATIDIKDIKEMPMAEMAK